MADIRKEDEILKLLQQMARDQPTTAGLLSWGKFLLAFGTQLVLLIICLAGMYFQLQENSKDIAANTAVIQARTDEILTVQHIQKSIVEIKTDLKEIKREVYRKK